MLDALRPIIVNNTIASNDYYRLGRCSLQYHRRYDRQRPGPTCTVNCGTSSKPQPAGLVTMAHSVVLKTNINQLPTILGARIICPAGHTVTDTVRPSMAPGGRLLSAC